MVKNICIRLQFNKNLPTIPKHDRYNVHLTYLELLRFKHHLVETNAQFTKKKCLHLLDIQEHHKQKRCRIGSGLPGSFVHFACWFACFGLFVNVDRL